MAPAACEYVIEVLFTWMSCLNKMIHFDCLKKRFFNDTLMRAVRDKICLKRWFLNNIYNNAYQQHPKMKLKFSQHR